MDYPKFVRAVAERTGFGSQEAVRKAIEATLEVLGERLIDIDRRVVAGQLPKPLAEILQRRRFDTDFGTEEFYERVAQRQGVAVGFGMEHAQAVCRVVGQSVGSEARTLLRKHLPESYWELFVPMRRSSGSVRRVPTGAYAAVPGRSLSEGRPGSRRPLSEAWGDRAQSESIARTDHPHADTKLSTSPGISVERNGETLASGNPASKRPLSEGREG